MADIDLKTATPDTSLPTTGFLFGADSQASASPSVYSIQTVATTLLGSTSLTGAPITTSQPVLDLAQTWNAGAVTFTGLKFNVTDTASAAGSLLMDLQVGGSSKFRVSKAGVGTFASTLTVLGDRVTILDSTISRSGGGFQFGLHVDAPELRVSSDVLLGRRAAANLRLGAADAAAPVAQTLSVQSVVAGTTNTAGANLTITGSQGTGTGAGGSIIFQVAPAGLSGPNQNALATALTIDGTGVATVTPSGVSGQGLVLRALNAGAGWTELAVYAGASDNVKGQFQVSPSAPNVMIGSRTNHRVDFSVADTPRWSISTSGHFLAALDNTYDIGATSSGRPRNVYASGLILGDTGSLSFGNRAAVSATNTNIVAVTNSSISSGGAMELWEMTAPSAPSTNRVRIYAEDNGSGKTRLMALFPTGAAVQIAIEP